MAMPPTVQAPRSATAVLDTESVVMMPSAAAWPPSALRLRDRGVGAGEERVHGEADADQPRGAHGDVARRDVAARGGQRRGDVLGGGVGIREALGTGAGVGAARVQDDGVETPV
ncbi:hypothetical protein GCM10025876_35240 [Demequina litorisediminis]|uniref:Uncharacterized protein n=1 Tax=Demequina litorisediminis TaxID=1849022 RepID=A0ABQ6IJ34_9MICO|nr:hypothetical protein GCM10025876_35240 [Demequina litorisediminis]